MAINATERSFRTFVLLVWSEELTLTILPTMLSALYLFKSAAFEVISRNRVDVLVTFKCSKLPNPCASGVTVGAVYFKLIQRPPQRFVVHQSKPCLVAEGATLSVFLYSLDAPTTETMAAAISEMGLIKYLQTDRTITLNDFWRVLSELTGIPALLLLLNP